MVLNTMATVGLSAAVLAGLGGGLGYAAEGSMPGDLLYGFKTNVNEGLLYNLNGSADARAEAEVALAERRMQELEGLRADGSVDAEIQADIEAQIETHLTNARQYVGSIEAEGDTEAAAELRTKLRTVLRSYDNADLDVMFDENAESSASMSSEADVSAGSTMDSSEAASASASEGMTDSSMEGSVDAEVEAEVDADAALSL